MTIYRVSPGQVLPSPRSGDVVKLASGVHNGVIPLTSNGITIEGEAGAILSANQLSNPVWTQEGERYWSTPVNFHPRILAVDGMQVGQIDDSKMSTRIRDPFGLTGFQIMETGDTWDIRTEWNGVGDFWEALYGVWGYANGRIYLRVNHETPYHYYVEAAPEVRGLNLANGTAIKNLELRLFSNAIKIDGTGGSVVDNVTIRNGNQRLIIEDGAEDNLIHNANAAMNFYGRTPGAWQGGSAEGEILYRFYKYIQGGSSSDDVGIELNRPGGGNHISHCWIHDGAIGIRQLSKGSGKNYISSNIIENNNSVGFVVGYLNDDTEVWNNEFNNNNIHLRGWRLQLSGTRRFWIFSNQFTNPRGRGVFLYGHVSDGNGRTHQDVEWNMYHNTVTGGRDTTPNWTFGKPQGVQVNNVYNGSGRLESIDSNLPGMRPKPIEAGYIQGRYPGPGLTGEDDEPAEEDIVRVRFMTEASATNLGRAGELVVTWKLHSPDGEYQFDELKVQAGEGEVIDLNRSFEHPNVAPEVPQSLALVIQGEDGSVLARADHSFTLEREAQITELDGSWRVVPL